MVNYKESGVDTEIGNICSKIMFEASKKTWENRQGLVGEIQASFNNFAGLRFSNIKNQNISMNFDGVGTKVELAERLSLYFNDFSFHKGIAFDLFAMVCEDAVIRGGEPILIGSILDVNKLNVEIVKNLAEGMVQAAKLANVAVVNGEIAELGLRIGGYGEYCYNWGAGLVWVADKKDLISGKDIKEGDLIIALKEDGFRSNGFSLIRKVMELKYGREWHTKNLKLVKKLLIPSKIYTKMLVELNKKFKPHGIAHITGGGMPEKLGRALSASGKGAVLNDLFEPPEAALILQKLGKVDDLEAYKTWNMGNGVLIITDKPEDTLKLAEKYNIKAKVCGKIVSTDFISWISKGNFLKEHEIKFFLNIK